MYVSIRRYEGIDAATVAQIAQQVTEGFIPIVSKAPGFVAYYLLDAGDGVLATVNIFESQAGAEESNRMAAGWIKENMAALVPNPPQITAGEVKVHRGA